METILFDLDDTLIESMHVWEDAIIHLFKKMNLYMSMEEARQIFFTMKFSEVLTYIKERFHTKQDEGCFACSTSPLLRPVCTIKLFFRYPSAIV